MTCTTRPDPRLPGCLRRRWILAGLLGAFLLVAAAPAPHATTAPPPASSALFDEQATQARPMRTGWLWFALFVLAGLLSAATCGYLAITRARPALPWFVAGLVGNVLAVIALLVSGRGDASALPGGIPAGLRKVPSTRPPRACAACGAMNHPAAAQCSACGGAMKPLVESESSRVGRRG